MFYDPRSGKHGLPHDPYKSCIAPRPIGWISTMSSDGVVNLAPYSFFNGVSTAPPVVMFASNGAGPAGEKDSRRNCKETGEFVVNIATFALREQVNQTSAPVPPEVDEMKLAGLTAMPSTNVAVPRVKESPINLECVFLKEVELPAVHPGKNAMILGQVVGVHIDDEVLTDGLVDIAKLKPIARMGYRDYAVVDSVFSLMRPTS